MSFQIRVGAAKELLYTGRRINGQEAFRLGLVNHVVAQNDTKDAAFVKSMMLARAIAKVELNIFTIFLS